MPGTEKAAEDVEARAHGSERSVTATAFTATAFLRAQPQLSIQKLMMFSNTAMMVESAVKLMNKEQRAPHAAAGHMLEHAGQRDEHQSGPSPVHPEGKACREDDKPGKQGHGGVQHADVHGLAGEAALPCRYTSRK